MTTTVSQEAAERGSERCVPRDGIESRPVSPLSLEMDRYS
jgi:hypothetical protein